ncbi:type IV pilin protein [Vibrio pectenicida]|uniref:Prepilin-type N-terminal cleavage/methylation domain-containing protein n=1 Tax=Vibrio pectenicida TaxID=62763 RepID=A0A427U0A8_9VIBR|nr:type IV pilin protein [Vibrio pectenicida]RSD30016.1 prepilin-type N-terminal cleavage/methylation domain-containing protein [Vibrio pectenicida]
MKLVIHCNQSKKSLNAMTLIELLIVMALISVLALVAYPNYQQQIRKAHRTVAIGDLAKLQLELEARYQGGYEWEDLVSGGRCDFCNSEPERFLFEINSDADSLYLIKAIAQEKSQQTLDSCLIISNTNYLSLDARNREFPKDCWQ